MINTRDLYDTPPKPWNPFNNQYHQNTDFRLLTGSACIYRAFRSITLFEQSLLIPYTMISRDHPVLPDNATYSYLAEGAANIVYKICVTPEVSPESVDEESEVDISQQREGYLASISQPNEFKGK